MAGTHFIEAIGDVSQIVHRTPGCDPRRSPEFVSGTHALWDQIDGRTSVSELILCGAMSPSHAVVVLQGLLEAGAIQLTPAPGIEDSFEIVDASDLDAPTPAEQALLAEEVDLLPWEKRRVLAAVRTLKRGNYFELLGVPPTAGKRELKRAYRELSKEFHPDRFYGKNLGSYRSLLGLVFQTATTAVRVLSDSRTVVPASTQAGGPRRRASERFPLAIAARLRCLSWPFPRDVHTGDVSEGGLFIVSDQPAPIGDEVALRLPLPEGGAIAARGVIAWCRTAEQAMTSGRPAGMGIALTLDSDAKERLLHLVAFARTAQPQPDPSPPTRLARGTGRMRAQGAPIIGIDLGTSYTSVSTVVGDRISVLPWPDGSLAIPSVIAFPREGPPIVGAEARERLLRDPRHAVAAAKRLLGRRADDAELASHLAQAAYDIATGSDGRVVIEMWGEPYAVPQLCGYLLAAARSAAEAALGGRVESAVVTVPVSFAGERIDLLRLAGRFAQLDIVEVVDEPSAAALANRYTPRFGGIIGVYDFGGGTFDFSVVDASGGDFRVLATAGDSWLGGDDFDYALAEAVANKFWRVSGVDVRGRAVEWQVLLRECERAKRRLSREETAGIRVPEVAWTAEGAQDLTMRLTRAPVNRLWVPVIERSLATCEQSLRLLGMRPEDLDAVYLSGGTCYVPAVRRALAERFRVPVRCGVPPEYSACLGAGVHATQLARRITPTLARSDG